jgi:hypothetical protein
MTNTAAIATKLNVLESAIVRVEEWASVMFVVVKGLGARFVSKKIVEVKKVEMKLTVDKHTDVKWVCNSETPTDNKYFPARAWVSIDKNGITGESKQATGTNAPSDELRAFALLQIQKLAAVKVAPVRHTHSYSKATYRRTSCLNCGITNTILMGRGYCTDCHGECD